MVDGLSTERNTLSAVLETMADGVVVVDRDGRVTLINHSAEDILGVKAGSSQGRRFIEVVRDHELQGLVSRALSSLQRQHGDIGLLTSRRFLSATATPLSGGDASGVLLTLHDQTRAQQIETTRRELVSNVSHELRSPLASIKAMVETLEEGALEEGEVARDFVQRIHREVDRMSALTDDILQLFRLESGQAQMEMAPVDVRSLVQDVLTQFNPRASGKGVALNVDFPETLPDVKGDEQRILQVLVNLVDNALKFTEKGGRVTISAGVSGDRMVVSVSDTGVGIPREHLPHIFERFYKVERSRRDSGTGLGLAIVKHIVQAHGGEVGVESQEGAGSMFTFTLPIHV
jgi:two-component system phosphate regulon sensor histidine kinase PhoR